MSPPTPAIAPELFKSSRETGGLEELRTCLDCPQPSHVGFLCAWHWHVLRRGIARRWKATECPAYLGPEVERRTPVEALVPYGDRVTADNRDKHSTAWTLETWKALLEDRPVRQVFRVPA